MNTPTLGEARFVSTKSHTTSDEIRIPQRIEVGSDPGILFELAGPRAKLFFDPKQTRAGIVTCGGLCPGLNNVIRSLFHELHYGYGVAEVLGFCGGYTGLDPKCGIEPVKITPSFVDHIHQHGGSVLSSSRGPVDIGRAVDNLIARGVNILFAVGGDGTQRGAYALYQEARKRGHALSVVGVPKTIDNDLACTELTFGFVTALDIATEALDRLHTTAESHDRVMILEVMGRHTGWIALHSGIAGGADVILIPEIPFSRQAVADKIRARDLAGSNFSIIVVAEGAAEIGHDLIYQDKGDSVRAPRLGGIGIHLQHDIEALTGRETRCVVLGHVQRGGRPNAFDRMLATNFGSCAVRSLASSDRGIMVALQAGDIVNVPLTDAIKNIKTVPPDGQLVRTARDTGISFCSPEEEKHHRIP